MLIEEIEQLKSQSLSEEEAFIVAARRIGKPVEIAGEFAKINKKTSSYNRILWACFAVMAYFFILSPSLGGGGSNNNASGHAV